MIRFFYADGKLQYTQEDRKGAIEEKQAFSIFADNLRELRSHCRLSLMELASELEIPNQTLSSYENKTHVPSMIQAIKIATYFHLTVEEMIACGFDEYPHDVTELYEMRKNK